MAVKYVLYLCPLIGTGNINVKPRDPYRSKLNNYIGAEKGGGFWSCMFYAKRMDLNTSWAEDAVHDQIALDTEILAISPRYDSLDSLNAWLNEASTGISPTILSSLESRKIHTAWLTTQHTNKDLIRYLRKVSMVEQLNRGTWRSVNSPPVNTLLNLNLEQQLNAFSAADLIALRAWFQEHGLSTTVIKAGSKVRDAVHFLVETLGLPEATLIGLDL